MISQAHKGFFEGFDVFWFHGTEKKREKLSTDLKLKNITILAKKKIKNSLDSVFF